MECSNKRDVFGVSVVNQKALNQNAQQVLVLIAAQILGVIEVQFGFSTNEISNIINV